MVLPITEVELNSIQDSYSTPMPLRGSSEDFFNLVEMVTGIPRAHFNVIKTLEQAKMIYYLLIDWVD